MEIVAKTFKKLLPHQRQSLEPYNIVATGYLSKYAPSQERTVAFDEAWHAFFELHGHRMPIAVTATLLRLDCSMP